MANEDVCKANIDRMLHNSQTKVIFPIITLGLLRDYHDSGQTVFSDGEVRRSYLRTVKQMKDHLGHDLHIGGKYYDAYASRNLPRYDVVRSVGHLRYELTPAYQESAEALLAWIPERIREHIVERLGVVPELGSHIYRATLSTDIDKFVGVVAEHIAKNPTNFEIFSFAIIRVHLEKFACKVYRDTRTSAHDSGVDLSTNYGVVYQIKKLAILNKTAAQNVYSELKLNFDTNRLNDGNVVLVIDDISRDIKQYLIDMKVQSISKHDLMNLARQFEDNEDREKILRIVYDEFRREYASRVV